MEQSSICRLWYKIWQTQWLQSYPCKTQTPQETRSSLQKFLEPNRKPKVIYTDKSLEFGKACEDLSWNHSRSTPHRSETNGIAQRAVRWTLFASDDEQSRETIPTPTFARTPSTTSSIIPVEFPQNSMVRKTDGLHYLRLLSSDWRS